MDKRVAWMIVKEMDSLRRQALPTYTYTDTTRGVVATHLNLSTFKNTLMRTLLLVGT